MGRVHQQHVSWEDYIGANKRSHEYNRYLADGIIRNLAASKPKDASASDVRRVGRCPRWSLLCGNVFGSGHGPPPACRLRPTPSEGSPDSSS